MRGASRAAFGEARDQLASVVSDATAAATVAEELFEIVGLFDREAGLRRALSDATSAQSARTGLVRELLGGRVSRATLDLVAGMAADRWAGPRDLTDATEQLAVLATAAAAQGADQLDDLEDELFRFSRIVRGEPELHAALASPRLPADRKRSVLDTLLEGKVTPQSLRLITQAAVYPRGRSLEATLSEYARLAAEWRQRLIALVRVATELTASQRERLAAWLAATYGHGIQLNVVLDPHVVGGMSIQIGDEFIDGSVANRLAVLRRRLAA
ncbi:MAG TPA: F0F1 ATP synthase subunit delta [Streptosporangiaceae bacterium]